MSKKATILITGDFCPVNRPGGLIEKSHYEEIFNDFLPYIRQSSLAITNLECPLTEVEKKIKKTGPSLRAPVITSKALESAGFRLVTLANNHIMDFGFSGLVSTIEACEKYGIGFIGAGKDLETARKSFYTQINGHTVAVLNFTENEFSTTHGMYPGANPLDMADNFRDITKAKEISDHVIVIVHGGHEMYDLPSPRMKSTFRFYAEAGASAVIGHHTHCYSGHEIHKDVPIFYGLGNLVFDSPSRRNSTWNIGFAVELSIDDNLSYNIIPYEQCNELPGVRLLNEKERKIFDDNFHRLNNIISDDVLLGVEFEKYCTKVTRRYLSYMEPHSIMLLHYLRNLKLFPSLLTRRKKDLYLNLTRCESHRDVIINILNERVNDLDL